MFGRGGAARKVADARQPRLVPAGEIPQRARPQRARVHLSTVVFVSMSTPVTEVKARIFERLVHTSPYQVAVGFDSLQSSASIQQLRSFVRTHHLGEQPLFVPMSGEASVARHTESIDNFAGGRGQSSGAELAALDWFAGSRFAWMWHLEDDTWSADFGSAASRYANSTADLIIHSGQRLPAWATAGGWKVGSNAHIRPCGPGLLCYASLAAYRASQRFARALLDEIHRGVASSTNTSHHGLYLPFVISQHPELTWQPLVRSHVVLSDDDDAQLERFALCTLQGAELFHPILSVCGSVEGYTLTNEPCKDCPHPARGVPTREACRALCDTHQSCDAWVHNTQGECYLKGGSRLHWQRDTSSWLRTWSGPRSTRKTTLGHRELPLSRSRSTMTWRTKSTAARSGAVSPLGAVSSGSSSSRSSSSSSSNYSPSDCRRILSESDSLEVGVLGGSISWGAELKDIDAERYSAQLQIRLQAQVAARVHNLAMPATGVGYASFCIDQVMPHDVQVLIVEFNFNDAYGHDTITSADSSEQTASLSFERLIRNVLSRQSPPWLIVVLAVCGNGWDTCEHMHKAVASHYAAQGVVSLSLHRDGVQMPISLHHNGSHHPTRAGHAECARLVENAIMKHSRGCHTWPRLPPPLLPLPLWESAHARWTCNACSYLECDRLQPLAAAGFELQGMGNNSLVVGMGKVLPPHSSTRS